MKSKVFHLIRNNLGDGILYLRVPFLIIVVTAFLMGCREEIISPDSPVNNVNEIIEERTTTNFTFSINSQNISFDVRQYPQLNTVKSRLSVYIADYTTGSTNVIVFNRSNILFQDEFKRNSSGNFIDFAGDNPTVIQIRCEDFTGKLRIQLTRIEEQGQ